MAKVLVLLSLSAFLLNVAVHLLTFVKDVPVSLGMTWPVYALSLLLALVGLGVKFTDAKRQGMRFAGMSQERVAEHVRNDVLQSPWTRFFGETPVWMVVTIACLFAHFAGTMVVDGVNAAKNGYVKSHEGENWLFDIDERPMRKATDAEVERSKIAELRMATTGFALAAFVTFTFFLGRCTSTGAIGAHSESG